MRLIDADALFRTVCGIRCGCEPDECGYEDDNGKYCEIAQFIEHAPTIEAVPEADRLQAQEITEYISKKEAVSRISDLLMIQLKGKRLPTWNEVYHAIND